MSMGKHCFIEQNGEGKFDTKAKGVERASGVFNTQEEAIAYAKELNPHDRPDVERVRNTGTGTRDRWRPV
jgi:hypothetical protein